MAPEFTNTERWFNTPGGRPQTLASLRRRGVVLVDFWTYTCINCLRTLPYLEAWDRRYRAEGLTIVGVHTPEFAFEHDAGNVANAIKRLGIRYPVVQDNEMGTWNAYANMYWPADYLIDSTGQVRYAGIGEGDYDKTEAAIRAAARGGRAARASGRTRGRSDVVVPVGPDHARDVPRHGARGRLAAGQPQPGRHTYPGAEGDAAAQRVRLRRQWTIGAAGGHRRRRRDDRRAGAGASASTSCSARPGGRRGRSRSCSTGAR